LKGEVLRGGNGVGRAIAADAKLLAGSNGLDGV